MNNPPAPSASSRTSSRQKQLSLSCAVVLCAVVGMSTLFGCAKKPTKIPPGAMEIVDDLGQTHVLTRPAARIVSLSPALTEVLFAVGCGGAVVLRDGWSDYPRAARKVAKITGLKPSAEAVLAARPDVVLASFPPATLRTGLKSAGVPIFAFNPVTLAQVADTFLKVGRICGHQDDARQLASDFKAEVAQVAAAVKGKKRPGVFLELDASADGQPFTLGKGSFGHELIEAAGGRNVFEEGRSAWFQVSIETVLSTNPEVILLADALTHKSRHTPETVASRPGWRGISAVKRGRVHAVSADWVSRPGPRLVLGLQQIAGLIHPAAFGLPAPSTNTVAQ